MGLYKSSVPATGVQKDKHTRALFSSNNGPSLLRPALFSFLCTHRKLVIETFPFSGWWWQGFSDGYASGRNISCQENFQGAHKKAEGSWDCIYERENTVPTILINFKMWFTLWRQQPQTSKLQIQCNVKKPWSFKTQPSINTKLRKKLLLSTLLTERIRFF